jgi:hypothetical protein
MPTASRDPSINWPLWWFARLEAAVERGDHAAASEAQRELERLGVSVHYGLPLQPEQVGRRRRRQPPRPGGKRGVTG